MALNVLTETSSCHHTTQSSNSNKLFKIQPHNKVLNNYLLGKGGYVFVSVGLSVSLWTTLLKKLLTDWDEILWRGPG